MAKVKKITARNSSELANVLGLSPSSGKEWEIRVQLLEKIITLVEQEELTHAVIAKKVGTSRTRITSILNRNLSHVSTDLLIRIITALGYTISFTIQREKIAA